MSIPKEKSRITITIDNEVLLLIEALKPLHPNFSKSQIVERAIIAYGQAVESYLSREVNNTKEEK